MYKFLMFLCLLSLQAASQNKVQVYLLGVYHMGGTSDALGVDLKKDNILGPQRQQDLDLLLNRLAKSNVEKIYVESFPERQVYWDSINTLHYTGKPVGSKNEIYQIGIKLAGRLGIRQGVKCVDWNQDRGKYVSDKYFKEYSLKMNLHIDSLEINEDEEYSAYDRNVLHELDDFNHKIPQMDLLSVFRRMNSEEYLHKFFYVNVTTFLDKNTNGLGAFWYQYNMVRNANIYSNIIKDILNDRPQKVLVIYGAGHIQALKDMFKAHPAIEVVEISTLLGE